MKIQFNYLLPAAAMVSSASASNTRKRVFKIHTQREIRAERAPGRNLRGGASNVEHYDPWLDIPRNLKEASMSMGFLASTEMSISMGLTPAEMSMSAGLTPAELSMSMGFLAPAEMSMSMGLVPAEISMSMELVPAEMSMSMGLVPAEMPMSMELTPDESTQSNPINEEEKVSTWEDVIEQFLMFLIKQVSGSS